MPKKHLKKIPVLLLSMASIAGADDSKEVTNNPIFNETLNGLSVKLLPKEGLQIAVDGIPFGFDGKFHVITPDWSRSLYGYHNDKKIGSSVKVSKTKNNGKLITFNLTGEDGIFIGKEEIELSQDRTIRIKLDGKLTTATSAQIEFPVTYVPAAWLTNTEIKYNTTTGDSVTTKTPLVAPGSSPELMRLAGSFKNLTIDSRYGDVEITTTATQSMSLLDYRKNSFAQGRQYYWLGYLSHPLNDKPVGYEASFKFPKKISLSKHENQKFKPEILTDNKIFSPAIGNDIVLPTPKNIQWSDGNFSPVGALTYSISSQKNESAIESILSQFFDKYKIKISKSQDSSATIVFKQDDALAVDTSNTPNDERYRISIDNGITISAATDKGFVNAVKTLEQLVRIGEKNTPEFKKVNIDDWPSLPFRGIHFFTGKTGRDLQIRMLRDILGPLKINTVIYQADYIHWDSMPKEAYHRNYGMTKEDAGKVAQEAQKDHIDIIPLVNTFGHSEWLLGSKVMKHLRDNPDNAYAYDPSNPEVYKLCEKIYDEAIALFKPSVMHIGHDEIDLEDFPFKPENKKIGATKLVIKDILHYYEYLKAKGLKIMIWGDMFLGPHEAPDATLAPSIEEAKVRRDSLPKDIIITDWHYRAAKPEAYKSISIWAKEGFDVIGSSWYAPDNILNQANEVTRVRQETSKSLGVLQTTWAGYTFDQNSFDSNGEQYAAYLLGAEAGWNGGQLPYAKLPYLYQNEFARMWNAGQFSKPVLGGWTVNMNKIANTTMNAKTMDHLALGDTDLQLDANGKIQLNQYVFSPAVENKIPRALVLASPANPSDNPGMESSTIDINKNASHLVFAVASTFDDPNFQSIGKAVITFTDNTTDEIQWIPGRNIFAMNDTRSSVKSPILHQFDRGNNLPKLSIYGLVWNNPNKTKTIKSVTLKSNNKTSALMLFGLSGIQE